MNMSCSSEESDENSMELTSADIINKAQNTLSVVPSKSQHKYMVAYNNFIAWKTQKKTKLFSENLLMAYFQELRNKYKPSSLWCIYSMLKSTLKSKHDIDIKKYIKLITLLKRYSVGFIKTESKLLSAEHMERFLNEAPDEKYLLTKVILIFGITGSCKRQELADLKLSDIENHGELFLVKIPDKKKQIPRTFVIQGHYYEIVKKYEALRVSKAKSSRFFQNYQRGKCTCQVVGVNKIGNTARVIATYLKLPDSEAYTRFRRTSASLMANSNKQKRFRRLRSRSCDVSEDNNGSSDKIKEEIGFDDSNPTSFVCELEEAGAANPHEEVRSPRQRSVTPSDNVTNSSVNENNRTFDISINNQSQTIQLPKQQITLNFSNCTNITIRLHN